MVLPNDTCRLCANAGNMCVPVFGKDGDENLLRHKLRICSPITVKETDKFPTQVCITCLSSLDQCYEFYQAIKKAQHKLQAMLEMDEDKRPLSDSDSTLPLKRQCFGSTVLTYPAGCHDLLNLKGSPTKEQKSPPLFVMVNGSKSQVNDDQLVKKEEQDTLKESKPNAVGAAEPKVALTTTQSKQNELSRGVQDNRPKVLEPNAQPNVQKTNAQSNVQRNIQKNAAPSNTSKDAQARPSESKSPSTRTATEKIIASVAPVTRPSVVEPKGPDASSNVPVAPGSLNVTQPEDESNSDQLDTTEPSNPSSSVLQYKSCRFCERQFPEETLAEHEALHPQGRKVFSCNVCNRSFFFEEAFKRHVARHDRRSTGSSD